MGSPRALPRRHRLNEVKAGLLRALQPADLGWNVDGEQAWAIAIADIDLQPLVDELLA